MEKRTFGKSGINVSRLGFGSMRLPMVKIGEESFVDIEQAVEVIRHAFELGVNYIDSAFLYCARESEIAVGRALKGWRDKVTLTTKVTKTRMERPGDLRRMLEHQLQKLDVDCVDFYCFHGVGWDNFHETDKKTGWIKDMIRAKDEGLVKHIAFSFHDEPEAMIRMIDLDMFDMVTCQYNYLDLRNTEAIAHAHEKGLAVVAMGPVGGGRLAGLPGFLNDADGLNISDAATLAVRFVLSNPAIDVVLSGMGNIQMVDKNVAAVEAGALSKTECQTLDGLLEKTKKMAELYCTGCEYCMPCPQGVNISARFEAMNAYKVYGMEAEARRRYERIRRNEEKSDGKGVCVECGACLEKCPQKIAIIDQLKETQAALGSVDVPA